MKGICAWCKGEKTSILYDLRIEKDSLPNRFLFCSTAHLKDYVNKKI